ncbi:MAG TPA: hypothetical protein VGN88_05885 [Phycisphaerae bacterium]|jgi:anti-sigma factor RsiW
MRQMIEEYLDGGLSAEAGHQMEATLARDPVAAKQLANAKAQRTLRTAAYNSYMPTAQESSALAAQMFAQAYAPAGRIGHWVRRGAAVAAGLVIVVGSFAIGRISVDQQINNPVETRVVYNVAYLDDMGEQRVKEFSSMEERDAVVEKLEQRGITNIQLAESTPSGQL